MARRTGNRRQEIIAKAYMVIGEQGYDAASIKEIAQAAGVAPGLVHYYFANKEELLLAVLKEASDRYTREMAQMSSTLLPDQLANAALAQPLSRVGREPEWYRLRFEFFAMGLRNPVIRPGLADLLGNGRAGIGAVVAKATGADQSPSQPVGALMLACFDGLALQKLADPDFDLEGAYKVFADVLNAYYRAR